MENIRRIEINAAIFPSVMSIGLGKPYEQSDTNEDAHKKIEAMIDLDCSRNSRQRKEEPCCR